MITMCRTGWWKLVLLLLWLALSTVACSTTNNNGNCDAQGQGNAVTCLQAAGSSLPISDQATGPSTPTSAVPSQVPSTSIPSTVQTPSQTPTVVGPTPEYLSDLTPLPGATPSTDPEQMGGVMYAHAIGTSSGGCGDNQQDKFSYVINRKFKIFKAVIGLDDQSIDNVPVDIEVIADGRTIFARNFIAGEVVNVTRAIADVREVDLKQIYLGPDPNICSRSVTAVWANAEVLP